MELRQNVANNWYKIQESDKVHTEKAVLVTTGGFFFSITEAFILISILL